MPQPASGNLNARQPRFFWPLILGPIFSGAVPMQAVILWSDEGARLTHNTGAGVDILGGSSDSAIDALANPNQTVANWGGNYNSGLLVDTYTIPVPEPSLFALIGLGGLVTARRTLSRK